MDTEYIVRRIKKLLAQDGSRGQHSRWGRYFYDKDTIYNDEPLCYVGWLTKKQVATQKPIHIFDIDYCSLPDEKLVQLFEIVVARYYRQR